MLESTQFRQPLKSVYRSSDADRPDDMFHWYEGGDPKNETIVMLHGYMAHALTFRRVFEHFLTEYHVIVPDLPAHGRDTSYRNEQRNPSMMGLIEWAQDLFAITNPDHIIAHSLGASVAFEALSETSAKTVTLVDPGIWIPSRRLDEWALSAVPPMLARLFATDVTMRIFEKMQWKGPKMSPTERNSYVAPLKEPDRLRFMTTLGADMLRHSRSKQDLHECGCPTLLLWGRHDRILPVSDAPLLAAEINADLYIFEDAGHSPAEDCPEKFSEIVLEFLRRG